VFSGWLGFARCPAARRLEDENDLCGEAFAMAQESNELKIYGGIGGFWDYGPLGVELKRNLKDAWWRDVVRRRDDVVGLDCSIIMNPKVWQASGHLDGFSDPMVTCRQCKRHMRADQLQDLYKNSEWIRSIGEKGHLIDDGLIEFRSEELARWSQRKGKKLAPGLALVRNPSVTLSWMADQAEKETLRMSLMDWLAHLATEQLAQTGLQTPCPHCGGELTAPRQFNLMFKTFVGAMEDSSSVAYLRPETAQGIFANYRNVLDTSRLKMPFGIAQIGKSFRNEINPRNYTFRSREFEQMEIEFFCHPDEADKWYEYWRDARYQWYVDLGLTSSKLRLRNHEPDELAHYARACADIEYEFPFGLSELEGVANRTDFDLRQHQEFNTVGKDMTYFDDQTGQRYLPFVIEPSGGVDRAVLAFLCEAYTEDEAPDEKGKMKARTVMRLNPRLAPVKVAVFPLVKKEGMPEIARKIYRDCQSAGLACFYDEKGAVGRRYRRQDEAGTPFCVTVDGQTLTDQTVTVRDRDSLTQDRIAADNVLAYVQDRLK